MAIHTSNVDPLPHQITQAIERCAVALVAGALLLLSMTIGGQTFGLPGLNLLWKERRVGADELQILLAPAATETAHAARPELIPPPTPPAPEPLPISTPGKRPDVNLPIARDAPQVKAPASSEERIIPVQGSEVPVNDAAQKLGEQDAREGALEQARL